MTRSLAVIGLGLMGSHMARNLARAGHEVRGFDPDPGRMAEFAGTGGVLGRDPIEAVEGCWGALLSLPDSDVSREVMLGPGGIGESADPPLYVYDTTTGRPEDAVEIATKLAGSGVEYSDTTLSGNSALAESGELVVMFGGEVDAYEAGRPIFEAIGRSHHHVGPVGAGARMKLIVNHALSVHRMVLAETLVVAELAELDMEATLDVLRDSLAYSRAMDSWGERMIAADHDPPRSRLSQGLKDARIIVAHGRSLGAAMDLAGVVLESLAEGEETGLGDLDNSSVMEVVRRRAGIGRIPSPDPEESSANE